MSPRAADRPELIVAVAGVAREWTRSDAQMPDEIIVMVDSDGSSPYEIVRYDRDSGSVRFNVPPAELAAGLFLRGLAVPPWAPRC